MAFSKAVFTFYEVQETHILFFVDNISTNFDKYQVLLRFICYHDQVFRGEQIYIDKKKKISFWD